MCGRLNINSEQLDPWVLDNWNIPFLSNTNLDLRPTNSVSTIVNINGNYQQLKTVWGIKPSWSKKPLINAQSETVLFKKTFKESFQLRRCLVPCSGWYEWRDEGGRRKQQYAFTQSQGLPLLMAGIWYENDGRSELVTLTTTSIGQCAEIHKRMPVLILQEEASYWFQSKAEDLEPLMSSMDENLIQISRV